MHTYKRSMADFDSARRAQRLLAPLDRSTGKRTRGVHSSELGSQPCSCEESVPSFLPPCGTNTPSVPLLLNPDTPSPRPGRPHLRLLGSSITQSLLHELWSGTWARPQATSILHLVSITAKRAGAGARIFQLAVTRPQDTYLISFCHRPTSSSNSYTRPKA